jgi:hypothetical protein
MPDLWHPQDFATGLLVTGRLLLQEFAHHSQSFYFLLQLQQFSFFSAKHFDGIFHALLGGYTLTALYGVAPEKKTSPEYRPRFRLSMAQMVRMPLQNGERSIHLF